MLEENGTEENISVSVRIRPISADEVSNGFSNIWKVNENSLATLPEVSVKINHTFGKSYFLYLNFRPYF